MAAQVREKEEVMPRSTRGDDEDKKTNLFTAQHFVI